MAEKNRNNDRLSTGIHTPLRNPSGAGFFIAVGDDAAANGHRHIVSAIGKRCPKSEAFRPENGRIDSA